VQDTPPSPAEAEPDGMGVDWIIQLLPSHRSANVRSVGGVAA
jgi:hypothetical protein